MSTQQSWVASHLEQGNTLSSLEAFEQRHITRLSSHIHRLRRAGMDITSTTIEHEGSRYSRYSLNV